MLKMDVHVDRASYTVDRIDSSTPVENRDGVFALLDDAELSAAERKRAGIVDDMPPPAPRGLAKVMTLRMPKMFKGLFGGANPADDDADV